MNIKEKIGLRVKRLRKEKNISQEALANISNIDRTYIQSIEKGERNISITILEKIASGFKISISELLKDI
ncbi:helix-turn-helix domain-containing protein [Flagellimonas meishanensis]|uniref:helix-turn-helix domain-containing protein n=1 Tax=Flagellimonas meishanensis TaxID=2873264 RepID=UPI001CA68923|nr:helix-turn-helix transcriptional regulator [[Muricauda] meishanensis]